MVDINKFFSFKNKENYRSVKPGLLKDEYINHTAFILSKIRGVTKSSMVDKLTQYLANNPDKFNPPIVRYRERKLDGFTRGFMQNDENHKTIVESHIGSVSTAENPEDIELLNRESEKNVFDDTSDIVSLSMPLDKYLEYPYKSNNILSPSGVVYFANKVKESLHSRFTVVGLKNRSKFKKAAKSAMLIKEYAKFSYFNTLQKARKVLNNALSGGYISNSTVLVNPSAHTTLTSVTRVVTSLGNAISESFIIGNRHYYDPDVTIENISMIVMLADKVAIRDSLVRYRLHIPTVQECLDMIRYNTTSYWKSVKHFKKIKLFLEGCDGIERAAIMYTNDFYHVRKYNSSFTLTLLKNYMLREALITDVTVARDIIKNAEDWILNFVVHKHLSDLTGLRLDRVNDKVALEIGNSISSFRVATTIYGEFINTFFITRSFPGNISRMKEMTRKVAVLSDTDSTTSTYDTWVSFYKDNNRVDDDAAGIAALIATFMGKSLEHYLVLLSANLNLDSSKWEVMRMKSEFYWSSFIKLFVSKHYYAGVKVVEMNVYDTIENPEKGLEVKGVHLIAGNAHPLARKVAEKMQLDIISTVERGEVLDVKRYIKEAIALEELIIENIDSGNLEIFKDEKINKEDAYKKEKEKSPYFHHMLWEAVFSKKYGVSPDAPYLAVKIPLKPNTKSEMDKMLASMVDGEVKDNLIAFLGEHNKTLLNIFRLPRVVVFEKGVPNELRPFIDYESIVHDNLAAVYLILETLGYFKSEGMMLRDSVY